MARFCSNCGTQVDETASFCPKCGAPINKEETFNNNFTNETNNTINFNNTNNDYYNNRPPMKSSHSYSKASLVLGILGIVFAWLYALVGHVLSIIGIVLGAKEYSETRNSTGLILSIVGEACSIISSVLGVILVSYAIGSYI